MNPAEVHLAQAAAIDAVKKFINDPFVMEAAITAAQAAFEKIDNNPSASVPLELDLSALEKFGIKQARVGVFVGPVMWEMHPNSDQITAYLCGQGGLTGYNPTTGQTSFTRLGEDGVPVVLHQRGEAHKPTATVDKDLAYLAVIAFHTQPGEVDVITAMRPDGLNQQLEFTS